MSKSISNHLSILELLDVATLDARGTKEWLQKALLKRKDGFTSDQRDRVKHIVIELENQAKEIDELIKERESNQ